MTRQRLTYLGLESFWWAALLLICFAVAVGVIIYLYRYERRLVSRPVGWGLLTLRISLLATLLLMALQPTLSWTSDLKEQTRVLVALDVSQSMDLVDDHAQERERMQWAVGLGMVKPEALAELGTPRFSSNQPDTDTVPQTPADESAADSEPLDEQEIQAQRLKELTQSWDTLSRFELARQLLSAPEQGLLDRLKRIGDVDVVLFARNATGVTVDQLNGARAKLAENLTGEITDYTQLLTDVANREQCAAVVLVTDGVDTTDQQPLTAAANLAGLARPVFSVLAGSVNQPVDLAIESTDSPETVYRKDQPLIRVRASTFGYEDQPIEISITDVGTGARISQDVVGGARFVDAEFNLPLNEAGRRRFIVDVQPKNIAGDSAPSGPGQAGGEQRSDNNQQEFSINVVDDTSRVLLADGEGRWEFRYLEAGLKRDDRVNLQTVLFEQPYLGLLPRSFFDSQLPNLNRPGGPFDKLDLVIWGDADSRNLDQATWEQLETFVADQGGTLVLATGKNHFGSQAQNPVLAQLMPITQFRPITSAGDDAERSPRQRGFHLQLTPQGRQHPLMKLDTDVAVNAQRWQQLPGHMWGLGGIPKPGAVVLAKPIGATGMGVRTEEMGSIIVHNYGLGRVVWIGIDSTWRWRARTGDRDHYRFWGQMTRWAAEMRTSTGSDDVRFGIDTSSISVGDETTVRARWSRKISQNVAQIDAFVEVYPADTDQTVPIMSFPLDPLATEPLLHEAKVPPLPVGNYRLQLKARDLPLGPRPIEAELFVTGRRNGETNRLSADRALLEQFASITNGDVFLPHELDKLLERLNPESLVLEQKRDIPLWNHWTLLMIMLGLLGGEWLLRKWHGLP